MSINRIIRPQRSGIITSAPDMGIPEFDIEQLDMTRVQQLMSIPVSAIDKELAERHLSEFIRLMWPTIDPHNYVHGWHIDAICEHAEAVINLEILRLVINIPPRHMKSITLSVGLTPWTWLKNPALQFVYFSYASTLSIRDGVKARRVFESPVYKQWWGDRFNLTSDQNTKIRYDNDKGGYRICTSVEGVATGEGGDLLIIDDANNVQEAESDAIRTGTNQWFDEVIQSRFNDPKTGALISIQQRSNANDLTGHIMKKYGNDYTYLILPGRFEVESRRKMALRTFHGFTDPRKKEGELLWKERFGIPEMAALEKGLGVFGTAGQIQQRPAPREGGIVPLDKFSRYKVMPARETWIRISISYDTALKEKELNAYSVGQVWVETPRGLFLLYIWRKKCRYPVLKRSAKNLCEEWVPHEVLIEDKSTGCVLIQDLEEDKKYPIKKIDPGGIDKVMRMEAEADAIESGLCWIPEDASVVVNSGIADHPCTWLAEFEDEVVDFPNSEYKDQIDPMSQYLKTVRERRQKQIPVVCPLVDEFQRDSHWNGDREYEEEE
jgi:predicted phage terminase large subunit-like protein